MEHLKRSHPFSRVMAKNVYNEYIGDRYTVREIVSVAVTHWNMKEAHLPRRDHSCPEQCHAHPAWPDCLDGYLDWYKQWMWSRSEWSLATSYNMVARIVLRCASSIVH